MTWVSNEVPAPQSVAQRPVDGAFAQHRVWITGASRGIGRAVAEDLLAAGARVVASARTPGSLDGLVRDYGPDRVLVVPGSVLDRDDLRRVEDVASSTWGGLDAVVCCAGVSPSFQLAEDLTPEVFREVIELNLTGTFLVAQTAVGLMGDGGSVLTISSVHARTGGRRLAAYSASKGGVEALTRALALDWADRGIRVNCLAPGYVETDMTADLRGSDHQRTRLLGRIPLGTIGRPEQLLGAVRLLLGPDGAYITGSVITVDGGWTAA